MNISQKVITTKDLKTGMIALMATPFSPKKELLLILKLDNGIVLAVDKNHVITSIIDNFNISTVERLYREKYDLKFIINKLSHFLYRQSEKTFPLKLIWTKKEILYNNEEKDDEDDKKIC